LLLQLLQDADMESDDELSMVMHGVLGGLLFHLGELTESEAHLEIAHRLCTPERHLSATFRLGTDTASLSRSYHAYNLAYLGHVDTALAVARDAVALARRTGYSFVITQVLAFAATCSVYLRDPARAASFAEEALAMAADHGFAFCETNAKIILGWVSAGQTGARAIRVGIASYRSMGAETALPDYFGLLSEAELAAGAPDAAVNAADEGLRWAEKNSEHAFDGSLFYSRGDAMMALGDQAEAEADYHRALARSRECSAKWIELNAALKLARLWQANGRGHDARDLLAPVYGWFTEGFDNPVLRDAKVLLEELTGKIDSAAISR